MAGTKAPQGYLKQSIDTPEGTINFGDAGATCFCGKFPWCAHLDEFITGQLDLLGFALSVWTTPVIAAIPFVPSRGLWVDVSFNRVQDTRYVVEINDGLVTRNNPELDTFLGVITQHETRAAVRNLINVWFQRNKAVKGTFCKSGVHGFKEQKALEIAEREMDKGFFLANDWYIRWTKGCLPCNRKGAGSFDDLLPDIGSAAAAAPTWNANKTRIEYR